MDLQLSDEQKLLVRNVRRFVREEIIPAEADLDPDGFELPQETHERLVGMTREMGLYNMSVPVEHGGGGLDATTLALLHEEMAQHRAGLYTACYGVFGAGGMAQLYDANDEIREKYLYPTLRGEKHGSAETGKPDSMHATSDPRAVGKLLAWPVDPPGLGSGPLSICTMSRQPSSARCPTMELPTMPAPITTTLAWEGRSLMEVLSK